VLQFGAQGFSWFVSGPNSRAKEDQMTLRADTTTDPRRPRGLKSRRAAVAHGLVWVALLAAPASALAAPAGSIRQFPTPSPNSRPAGIAPGPEGNMWFTEERENKIGRISLSGSPITEFSIPTPESEPTGITLGPDGNLWFTESGANKIGRITPAGAITEFPLPANSNPNQIATGPDGNVWFTEDAETLEEVENTEKSEKEIIRHPHGLIGRITPAGALEGWAIPTAGGKPAGITTGPDGNVWFTEENANNIGRITPSGAISEFHVTGGGNPHGIAPGPNGEVWFTVPGGNKIGRIPPSGSPITLTQIPTPNSQPNGIALGPDGALWFSENGPHKVIIEGHEVEREFSRIGRITPGEQINEYATEIPESGPTAIAPGADGNLWFTESNRNNIARVGAGVLEPLVGALAVAGNHEAGTAQACAATWATWAGLQPAIVFGFDRYTFYLNGVPVQSSASPVFIPSLAQVGYQLSCTATLTYPLMNVTTSAASAPVPVIPPPPTLGAVKQSASKWRVGGKLASISAKHKGGGGKGRKHRKRQPPRGTTFSFSLNEQAGVTLTFTQVVKGRKVGKKCVATTRRNRKRRSCDRTVTLGHLAFTGHAGLDKVRFEGRLSSRHKLKPGPYTVTIQAANSTGPSAATVLRFTIVK
jgi:streptogramin lyase